MPNPPRWCSDIDCDGELAEVHDELLPAFMARLECDECGQWYVFDRETGYLEVDA